MAQFSNLFRSAQTVSEILQAYGSVTAEVGFPPEAADDPTERVVVTLMWVTPEPIHRNDPWERGSDGQSTPPPLTLSAFFLITAYGTTANEPEGAYNNLGRVLQAIHSRPTFELPDSSLATPNMGTGSLSIVHVPTAADLMEKVYSPLNVKQRPWALLQVGPVQLSSFHDAALGAPAVRPGGTELAGLEVLNRPELTRISPSEVARGGRVRLDGSWGGTVSRVRVGSVEVAPADISQPAADGPVIVRLQNLMPPVVPAGAHAVSVQVGNQWSESEQVLVRELGTPSVFSPAVPSASVSVDLFLDGRDLQTATHAYFWPDSTVAVPAEVLEVALAPADVNPTQVRIPSAALPVPASGRRAYRISLKMSPQVYTPFVVMELSA